MKYLFLCLLLTFSASAAEKNTILLVLTNHSELGDTGEKTGFFLSEAAHPYQVFTEKEYPVTIASPEGGFAPIDPKSLDLKDKANESFWLKYSNKDEKNPGLPLTKPLSEIDPADYTAVSFAGGHGSVWDFPENKDIQRITSAIYTANGSVGAVCHGPAALVNVKLPDGTHLISGKETAVFTNHEEEAVGLAEVVPFLLQNKFENAGAAVETAENFKKNAIRDGRLVTGQNPASAEKAAKLLIEAIEDTEDSTPPR
ncbi:type 1 glutamine amidotransferase domain-containing protein [Luteolibacter sp. AS25]|uniref:type 1 glutamine amidotransferase domain-containing protein n=1 Tax=Luteolibacter sp. AS25 TaxID=3135776 RepID=UPI00398A9813